MTDDRLLFGILAAIGVAVSFGLTVLFFGFVVLAGLLLMVVGLSLLAVPGRRRPAAQALTIAGVALSGPITYVALAVLRPLL